MKLPITKFDQINTPPVGAGYAFIDKDDHKLKIKKHDSVVEFSNSFNDVELLGLNFNYLNNFNLPDTCVKPSAEYNTYTITPSEDNISISFDHSNIPNDVYGIEYDLIINCESKNPSISFPASVTIDQELNFNKLYKYYFKVKDLIAENKQFLTLENKVMAVDPSYPTTATGIWFYDSNNNWVESGYEGVEYIDETFAFGSEHNSIVINNFILNTVNFSTYIKNITINDSYFISDIIFNYDPDFETGDHSINLNINYFECSLFVLSNMCDYDYGDRITFTGSITNSVFSSGFDLYHWFVDVNITFDGIGDEHDRHGYINVCNFNSIVKNSYINKLSLGGHSNATFENSTINEFNQQPGDGHIMGYDSTYNFRNSVVKYFKINFDHNGNILINLEGNTTFVLNNIENVDNKYLQFNIGEGSTLKISNMLQEFVTTNETELGMDNDKYVYIASNNGTYEYFEVEDA